jgi:hypothetical protein
LARPAFAAGLVVSEAIPEHSGSLPSSSLTVLSYDLAFWCQHESEERPPAKLYEAFVDGQRVDGIPDLPVDEFLTRVLEAFPTATREPNGVSEWVVWERPDGSASFQVEWTPQCVRATFRPLNEDEANRLIDLANDFGCALYDPQTEERFSL